MALPEYYIQYIPGAADLLLPVFGVKAESPLQDRVIAGLEGFVTASVILQGLKHVVSEQRPDGSSFNSFPSGHSSTAFLGAELVRHEYGWGWGAGAYAVATSVAVLRVVHDRHWWWDTVAGAGIGIIGANIGCMMLEPTKKLLGLYPKGNGSIAVVPTIDPYTETMCASLSITF